MKVGKVARLIVCGLVVFILAACGAKSPEDLEKNVLKDSYTGYSEVYGYDSLIFTEKGSTLVFDKKNHKIVNGDKAYFYEIVPEDELKSPMKGILTKHSDELKNKDYFIINVSYNKDNIWGKTGDQLYCVVLENGGKDIRIFEFETGYTADGYYDFIGKAD